MSNVPPPQPPSPSYAPEPLAYATPLHYGVPSGGIWVNEKRQIVGPNTIVLPHRCVKCNEPGSKRLIKKYSWHHPAIALIVLLNIFIYIIVALVVRKRGTAKFSLCAAHARGRTMKLIVAWLGVPASIAVSIAGGILGDQRAISRDLTPFVVVAGIVGAIFFLLFALMQLPVLRPKYIDKHEMRLAGAGEPFLQSSMDVAPPVAAAVD